MNKMQMVTKIGLFIRSFLYIFFCRVTARYTGVKRCLTGVKRLAPHPTAPYPNLFRWRVHCRCLPMRSAKFCRRPLPAHAAKARLHQPLPPPVDDRGGTQGPEDTMANQFLQ